jgi:hypothetical protein
MRFFKLLSNEGIAHAALLGLVATEWTTFFIKTLLDFEYYQYLIEFIERIQATLSIESLFLFVQPITLTALLIVAYLSVLFIALVCINYCWRKLGLKQLFE